eukprot:TRINITY_DN4432_c0_g1_i1.p1 TRINITY_DN4432_c0_g1~~TRINITY_DN4432_c0_g1_i1.p1  ORF type:complete len:528 (+),score=124.88 TRINITY_DN4432_c0_g1_i1:70-1653(+)
MCGIIGIVTDGDANQDVYEGLTVLQHRGQDAAGICTLEENKLHMRKGLGLVRDVFQQHHMQTLRGHIGVGHVRYPTAGCSSSAESQPFYANSPYGLVLAHNGNLVNSDELAQQVQEQEFRHLNTTSDSEVLLNVFAQELQRRNKRHLQPDDVFEAMTNVNRRSVGGYACVGIVVGLGMIAFRDPYGIRPIVFGRRKALSTSTSSSSSSSSSSLADPSAPQAAAETTRYDYCISSESVALDVLGYKLERDILPGEVIVITLDGTIHTKVCAEKTYLRPCIFEFVYFARPDSIMDGISVYKSRLRMGEKLADKILRLWPDHNIDVVIPVPDTSRTAALQLANNIKVPYREGFMKNRYIGRTFIMPGQTLRKKSVRQKLNAIDLEFRGKRVLLVDDSIVRGTTSKEIINMAREAGAISVYLASCAPPVRYPNVYGIDMPTASELIAHNRTEDEICQAIGADRVIYQDLSDLIDSCYRGNTSVDGFETSVFDQVYCTTGVTHEYLDRIAGARNDSAKQAHAQNDEQAPRVM